jgi:hypothetical protein
MFFNIALFGENSNVICPKRPSQNEFAHYIHLHQISARSFCPTDQQRPALASGFGLDYHPQCHGGRAWMRNTKGPLTAG